MKCSICQGEVDEHKLPDGEVYWTQGHNAWPINDGRCCTDCNQTHVLRARIVEMGKQVQEIENATAK